MLWVASCIQSSPAYVQSYRYPKPIFQNRVDSRRLSSVVFSLPLLHLAPCIPRRLVRAHASSVSTSNPPPPPISNRSPTHLPLLRTHTETTSTAFAFCSRTVNGSSRLPSRLLRVRRERAAQLVAHLPHADRAHLRLLPVSLRVSDPGALASLPTRAQNLHPSFPRTPRAGLPSMHSVWSMVGGALHLSLQAAAK